MVIKIINCFLPLILIFGFNSLFAIENSTELYNKGADLAENGRLDEAIVVFKSVIKKANRIPVQTSTSNSTTFLKNPSLSANLQHPVFRVLALIKVPSPLTRKTKLLSIARD